MSDRPHVLVILIHDLPLEGFQLVCYYSSLKPETFWQKVTISMRDVSVNCLLEKAGGLFQKIW